MTTKDRIIKNALFGAVSVFYLAGYMILNVSTVGRKDLHHLALPHESEIPFIPQFIFGYLALYIFLAVAYLFIDDLDYFRKVVKAFLLCVLIHFVIFLIYPVEYNLRPVLDPEQGWLSRLIVFYYWVDLPYNCFPSMHISNAFLVAFFMHRYRRFWGWILFPLATLVAISTVLVKQHYIVDAATGFFVGWGVYGWVFCRPILGKRLSISGHSAKIL